MEDLADPCCGDAEFEGELVGAEVEWLEEFFVQDFAWVGGGALNVPPVSGSADGGNCVGHFIFLESPSHPD